MKDQLLLKEIRSVLPVFYLDRICGPKTRRVFAYVFGSISFLLLFIAVLLTLDTFVLPAFLAKYISYLYSLLLQIPGIHAEGLQIVSFPLLPFSKIVAFPLVEGMGKWNGVLLFSLLTYILCKLFDLYARSHYYRTPAAVDRGARIYGVSYLVERILINTQHGDLLASLVNDSVGRVFMMRLGISLQEAVEFLSWRGEATDYRTFPRYAEMATFRDLIDLLFSNQFLREWVEHKGILVEDIEIAADWVEHDYKQLVSYERWWGLESLSRLHPIGEDFAFGYGFQLKRFATAIVPGPVEYAHRYGGKDVEILEENLSRSDSSNALVIAENIGLAEDLVLEFAKDISHIAHAKAFNFKHCYYFDVSLFCQSVGSVSEFESTLQSVLFDAKRVGNVILVFSNLPLLFIKAERLGADMAGILRPYLLDSGLQIVALSDVYQYHSVLSLKPDLTTLFHEMHLLTPEGSSLLKKIQTEALAIEATYHCWFSVGSLRQIIKDAERTLVHGILPDRTREILLAVGPYAEKNSISVVLPSHIDDFVSFHANMPMGSTNSEEEVRLLGLETLLHQSIVGQHRAVVAVSEALRRSRLGVRNEKKPIASFLFFGPTGVGKTEVAKTLAKVFFGGEDRFLRFDMSEFSKDDAMTHLIGSEERGEGLLTSSLREHPYGVLLLDEFEKSARTVQDLFLQILDEGVFHDAHGHPVNCKNVIIVATSNAGAEEMYKRVLEEKVVDEAIKKEIISDIISKGTFRPELLNRFDGLVLFEPLTKEASVQIARLMLEKLAKRLLEKKIVLTINDALLNIVVKKGIDPAFGARPMQRVIQDIVESKVADKILRHEVGEGVPLEFKEEDFM